MFPCPFCQRRFRQREGLRVHLNSSSACQILSQESESLDDTNVPQDVELSSLSSTGHQLSPHSFDHHSHHASSSSSPVQSIEDNQFRLLGYESEDSNNDSDYIDSNTGRMSTSSSLSTQHISYQDTNTSTNRYYRNTDSDSQRSSTDLLAEFFHDHMGFDSSDDVTDGEEENDDEVDIEEEEAESLPDYLGHEDTSDTAVLQYQQPYPSQDDTSFHSMNTESSEQEPIHVVEAKLLHLFVKYSIPLYAFRSFMLWSRLSRNTNYHYEDSNTSTFTSTMKRLTSHKSMSHNIPFIVDVQIPSLPPVSVRIFPFLKNVKFLLRDKDMMKDSVWRHDPASLHYTEMNTGSWWGKAERTMHSRLASMGIPNLNKHFLCPVIFFIDKTHCDRNGRLNAEPVLCSIGNIALRNRKKPSSWFILGLMPMQQHSSAERSRLRRGTGLRSDHLQLYHKCLGEIFSEIA